MLFTCHDAGGTIPPVLALAEALIAQGHEVVILSQPSVRAPNVTITDYVPHSLELDQTEVMVTHAGLGSVAGAMEYGVPIVCMPGDRDQPLNAQRVADLGAGGADRAAAEIESLLD